MVDVHTPEQRSKNMAAIKGKDTQPELRLRKYLWGKGLRYRVKTKLPGKPDIVFISKKVAIFIDGCFWHRCPIHFKLPATRTDFWDGKITDNVERDKRNNSVLVSQEWTVLRFWEHEIRQNMDRVGQEILEAIYK